MGQKATFPRSQLEAFGAWLLKNGFYVEDARGRYAYQVIRITKPGLKAPIIVYENGDPLSSVYFLRDSDMSYVCGFWMEKKADEPVVLDVVKPAAVTIKPYTRYAPPPGATDHWLKTKFAERQKITKPLLEGVWETDDTPPWEEAAPRTNFERLKEMSLEAAADALAFVVAGAYPVSELSLGVVLAEWLRRMDPDDGTLRG